MYKLFIVFFIFIVFLILFKKQKRVETFKLCKKCKKNKFRIENLYCDRQTQRWYKPDYGWFIPGHEILNK